MILNVIKILSSLLQSNETFIDWKPSNAFYPIWPGRKLGTFTTQSLCLSATSRKNDHFPNENPKIETSMRKATTQTKKQNLGSHFECPLLGYSQLSFLNAMNHNHWSRFQVAFLRIELVNLWFPKGPRNPKQRSAGPRDAEKREKGKSTDKPSKKNNRTKTHKKDKTERQRQGMKQARTEPTTKQIHGRTHHRGRKRPTHNPTINKRAPSNKQQRKESTERRRKGTNNPKLQHYRKDYMMTEEAHTSPLGTHEPCRYNLSRQPITYLAGTR